LRKSANIEYVPIKPNPQLGKRESAALAKIAERPPWQLRPFCCVFKEMFDYSSWGQQTDNSPPPTEEVIREIND
jgi:hypothetical protein